MRLALHPPPLSQLCPSSILLSWLVFLIIAERRMADVDLFRYLDIPGEPIAPQWVAYAFIGPAFAGYGAHMALWGAVVNHFFAYLSSDLYKRDAGRTKVSFSILLLSSRASVGAAALSAGLICLLDRSFSGRWCCSIQLL